MLSASSIYLLFIHCYVYVYIHIYIYIDIDISIYLFLRAIVSRCVAHSMYTVDILQDCARTWRHMLLLSISSIQESPAAAALTAERTKMKKATHHTAAYERFHLHPSPYISCVHYETIGAV